MEGAWDGMSVLASPAHLCALRYEAPNGREEKALVLFRVYGMAGHSPQPLYGR